VGASALTAAEQDRVRAAIRFLRVRTGADTLAKALHAHRVTLRRVLAGRTVSESVAFRVARLAGVGVDDLLAEKYPPPGTCAYCGHRKDVAEAAE
jgi:hypothetical protein